jgi:predicted RNA binding protein YcfA (HicA-like mRNA interferase family)
MSALPVVSGRECVKALEQVGFHLHHQKGSHMIVKRDEPKTTISVPNHKELRPGMLRSIIRQAGLTVDEFVSLL